MSPLQSEVARFEATGEDVPPRERVVVSPGGLRLLRDHVTVTQVPTTLSTIEVLISPNGRWIWHLGEDGSPLVTLFDGGTLEMSDSFRPRDVYGGEGLLRDWCELTAAVSVHAPDMLIAYANAGDSFVLLLTLRATSEGIVDSAGSRVFSAVDSLLDEVIWHASFIATDRLLVVDDIGSVTTLSWPGAEILSRVSVGEALSAGEQFVVWPGEICDSLVIGIDSYATDELVLISVCDHEAPERLVAFAALDPRTLAIRGGVRPPVTYAGQMRQVDRNRFVVRVAGSSLVMRLTS